MKNNLLLLLFLVQVIFACENGKSNANYYSSGFTYTIDTVVIDPKGHIFDLKGNLFASDISPDGTYLGNFNTFMFGMEYVDLENLQFTKFDSLALEGPNGLGDSYVFGLKLLDNKEAFLSTGQTIAFKNGKELKALDRENFFKKFKGDSFATEWVSNETISNNGSQYVGLLMPPDLDSSPNGLLWVDFETKTKHIIPLDDFKEFTKYNIIQYIGKYPANAFSQAYYLQFYEDKVLLTASLENSVWVIDKEKKSVKKHTFQSNFLPNTHKITYPNRVESEVELEALKKFEEAKKEKSKQPSYSKWEFDKKTGLFWRLSQAMDHMLGDKIIYKSILTSFDTKFNQVNEFELPEEFSYDERFFIHDGLFYSFLNLDDEMAFIRFKPEF